MVFSFADQAIYEEKIKEAKERLSSLPGTAPAI